MSFAFKELNKIVCSLKGSTMKLKNAVSRMKEDLGEGDKVAQYWERMQDNGKIKMPKERIYLAGSYTDVDPCVVKQRVERLSVAAGLLMKQGCVVFSPISHSAYIVDNISGIPKTHKFWLEQCDSFLEHWATKLLVLPNDCWWESTGVKHEIKKAIELNMNVEIAHKLQSAILMQERRNLPQKYLIETRLDEGEPFNRIMDKKFNLSVYSS